MVSGAARLYIRGLGAQTAGMPPLDRLGHGFGKDEGTLSRGKDDPDLAMLNLPVPIIHSTGEVLAIGPSQSFDRDRKGLFFSGNVQRQDRARLP